MPPHLPQGTDIVFDSDHASGHKSSAGPLIGTAIVVILLLLGALYFWGAQLNRQKTMEQLPVILGDSTTTTR